MANIVAASKNPLIVRKNTGKLSFFINNSVELARSNTSMSVVEIETIVNDKWTTLLTERKSSREDPKKQDYVNFMQIEIPKIKKDLEESESFTNKRQIHNLARRKAQDKWKLQPNNPRNEKKKLHPFAVALDQLTTNMQNYSQTSDNSQKKCYLTLCETWEYDGEDKPTPCGNFLNREIPSLTKETIENGTFNGFATHLQVYKKAMSNWKKARLESPVQKVVRVSKGKKTDKAAIVEQENILLEN